MIHAGLRAESSEQHFNTHERNVTSHLAQELGLISRVSRHHHSQHTFS